MTQAALRKKNQKRGLKFKQESSAFSYPFSTGIIVETPEGFEDLYQDLKEAKRLGQERHEDDVMLELMNELMFSTEQNGAKNKNYTANHVSTFYGMSYEKESVTWCPVTKR